MIGALVCKQCGRKFYPQHRLGPIPVYCEERCRVAAKIDKMMARKWAALPPVVCRRCGRSVPRTHRIGRPRSLCENCRREERAP